MDWLIIYIFTFLLGSALGSFVNMLVFRTAVAYGLKKGKVRPKYGDKRSVCDHCGRQLAWKENIPIISWAIQGGKSKCCATPLPYQYPLVEIGGGIVAVLTAVKIINQVGINWLGLGLELGIVTILILETVFDLRYLILPDYATAILATVVLIYSLNSGQNIVDGLAGAGVFSLVIGGIYLVTRGGGMGFGDVKLAPVLGWWLGLKLAIVALYLAFLSGAVVGLGLLGLRLVKRKDPIPFGPFLMAGAYAAWWGGEWWKELVSKIFNF